VHVDGVPVPNEFESDTIVLMCVNKTMTSEPITVLICSGVFERHRSYTSYQLAAPPSFYFHRQVFGTYIQDEVGIRMRAEVGVENIMWGNDYPHVDGIWPHSDASIQSHFERVPDDELHAILAGNAVRLYGL
jgi:predicted TIM-barrel fold metal-dependent hydrolase